MTDQQLIIELTDLARRLRAFFKNADPHSTHAEATNLIEEAIRKLTDGNQTKH
jgi:hypothetical protein